MGDYKHIVIYIYIYIHTNICIYIYITITITITIDNYHVYVLSCICLMHLSSVFCLVFSCLPFCIRSYSNDSQEYVQP